MATQSQNADNWNQTPRSGDQGNVWIGIATALQTADTNICSSVASYLAPGPFNQTGCNCASLTPLFPAFSLPAGDYVSAATLTIRHTSGTPDATPADGGSILFENTGTTLGLGYTSEVINLNPLLFTVAALNIGPTNAGSLLYHGVGVVLGPVINGFIQPQVDRVILTITTAAPPPPGGSIVDNAMQVRPNFSERTF